MGSPLRLFAAATFLVACANADNPVDAQLALGDATPGCDEGARELCDNELDDDCDGNVDEGFANLGVACSLGTGACAANGVYVCAVDGLATECNAVPASTKAELCNGLDDDCDGTPDNGFQINQACDGAGDTDKCAEGVWVCDGAGGRSCTDTTGSTADLCGGGDDDCDPDSTDGSEDTAVGVMCDGGDSDLCKEGMTACLTGLLQCTDATGSTTDNCGNGDEDCDPASADGSEHPGRGAVCDGADSDLCTEGTMQCTGTVLACNDVTGSTVDLCGNGDEDCDATSSDGAEDTAVGLSCDGPGDTDSCKEAVSTCTSGTVSCPDTTGSTTELCAGDAIDENCNGQIDEGYAWQAESPTCSAAVDLVVSGDTGAQTDTDSWYNAEWDRLLITEDSTSSLYVSATVQLYSPPGVDYDLYAYCFGCPGTAVTSSAVANMTGHTETIHLRAEDDTAVDDSHYVYLEVRYRNANRCARWTLTVTGNTSVTTATCNP